MNEELAVYEAKPLTAAEIRGQVNLIQEVMKSVMQDKVHFGTVPGCGDKPTLLKPGAEKIMATFRLSADPEVEDLSFNDVLRYRVKCKLLSQSGIFKGAGVGECSSEEEKYKWRKMVSEAEWNATPETHRRIKYRYDREEKQIRTNPYDLANTLLKMAKKRALVDAVLTVTGASDIFTQDIEDMPEEIINHKSKPPIQQPQKKAAEGPAAVEIEAIEIMVEKVEKSLKSEALFITGQSEEGEEIKFSTFDKKLAEASKALIGQLASVSFTLSKDGKYKNITAIVQIADRQPGAEG